MILFDEALDIDDSTSRPVGCLWSHGNLIYITILTLVLGANDLQCGIFYYLVCNGLLHKVDFALTNQFHMHVSQRDLKLLGLAITQSAQCTRRTPTVYTLLHGRVDEKRVRLRAEVEVLGEGALTQPQCVSFHLE